MALEEFDQGRKLSENSLECRGVIIVTPASKLQNFQFVKFLLQQMVYCFNSVNQIVIIL
jgi:hypothetical protein